MCERLEFGVYFLWYTEVTQYKFCTTLRCANLNWALPRASHGVPPRRRLPRSIGALPQPTASPISLGSAQAMPIPVYRDSVPGDAFPGLIGLCPGRRPSRSHRALPRTRSFPVFRRTLPRASHRGISLTEGFPEPIHPDLRHPHRSVCHSTVCLAISLFPWCSQKPSRISRLFKILPLYMYVGWWNNFF